MAVDFRMAVPIESHSHRLTPDSFGEMLSDEAYVWFSDVREHTCFLRARNHFGLQTQEEFIQFGHYSLSMMLIALNVASLGHFTWLANEKCPYPQYSLHVPGGPSSVVSVHVRHNHRYPSENQREFSHADAKRTMLVFYALSRETDAETIRPEYLKGVFHLGHSLVDLDFRREAFGNFYRALEFFVAKKVLQTTKLSNEVRDVCSALQGLGIGAEAQEEFRRLYRLRSEQVMHAQRPQVQIEWEDAVKLKTLLDGVMNAHYRPVWAAAIQPDLNSKSPPEATGS